MDGVFAQSVYDLPIGKQAISVSVKGLAEGVSGKLKAGDIVSVYAVFNRGDAEENYSAAQPPELKYMRVLAVTDSVARDIDVDSNNEFESDKNTADGRENLPSTVILLAGDVQAAALAGIDHNATIHMALVARSNNDEVCKAFLAEQDEYIEKLLTADEETDETKSSTESGNSQPETSSAGAPAQEPQSEPEENNNG